MAEVKFHDYTAEVIGRLSELTENVMEEVGGELEAQVKRNQDRYRDTGFTSNSWTHRVSVNTDEYRTDVGSAAENAIWEEFGTGEYALNGDGRKGGWFYKDEEGVGHFTHGKHPRRHFWKAYTTNKNKLIKRIQNTIGKGLS